MYSSACICAHIADAPFDWLGSLSHLVACLKGALADTRDDLSDGERSALEYIQQSVQVERCLPKLEQEFSYLQELMCAAPDADVDAVCLRQTSIILTVESYLLEADMPRFDRFISRMSISFLLRCAASDVPLWQHTTPAQSEHPPANCPAPKNECRT